MNDEHQNSEANRGELSTRTMAMPADTNPSGDIFGGWLLAQMDIAGVIVSPCLAHCVRG
jgi:acyl-CoA thioesterase YciA